MDEYIKTQPATVQEILEKIRRLIRTVAPAATETMSYGIPTFDLNGKHLIHFAGFKNHISLFPTPAVIEVFKDELGKYKTAKGTIQFPINKPIPNNLIKRIAMYRINMLTG